ncbi:MAG: hypothetical protein JSV17_03820 [Candidatus Aminicenantes bacterium]|nr:MAG: hypothetical protein JSV17_03820 [Candidatus Aminicenantes bacterium]
MRGIKRHKRSDEETSLYFQAVSRFFLEHRGSPFFLSAQEVDNIREWKNMDIPLPIVREGIKDCIVAHRKRPGRKGKILSLSFCRPFVLRSYEAYKERKVGGKRSPIRREDKRRELEKAVEGFLEICPDSFPGIRQVFSRVLNLISQDADEELLEDLESKVEALAIGMASEAERDQIRNEVRAEFGNRSSQELDRIQDLKLIKHIREKYAIPHISLYYY